jgi:hypothetical protein
VFWLLRILLVILIVRALWRLLRGVLEGSGWAPPRPDQLDRSVALQRDPVCGTFVVPSRALTAPGHDGTKYFCSDRCRRAYAERRAG